MASLKVPTHKANHPHLHRQKLSVTGKSAFPATPVAAFSPTGDPSPKQAFDTSAEGG